MVYVKRDKDLNVIAASLERSADCCEEIDPCSEELELFTQQLAHSDDALKRSDLPMVRVLDDLIDLLVLRGVIRFTDFPEEAQQKLCERRSLREQRDGLFLLGDELEKLL